LRASFLANSRSHTSLVVALVKKQELATRNNGHIPFPALQSVIPSRPELSRQESGRISRAMFHLWSESSLPPPDAFFPAGLIAFLSQDVIWVAQLTFRDLKNVPDEKFVILAPIPGYPDQREAEISMEIWPMINTTVHSVTIALESGACPS
jgi:hypothetical protein